MLPPTLSRTSPRFNPNGRSVARQARRTRESVCPAPRRPIPKPTLSCCVESPSDLAPLRTVNVDQRTEARKSSQEEHNPALGFLAETTALYIVVSSPLKKSPRNTPPFVARPLSHRFASFAQLAFLAFSSRKTCVLTARAANRTVGHENPTTLPLFRFSQGGASPPVSEKKKSTTARSPYRRTRVVASTSSSPPEVTPFSSLRR